MFLAGTNGTRQREDRTLSYTKVRPMTTTTRPMTAPCHTAPVGRGPSLVTVLVPGPLACHGFKVFKIFKLQLLELPS